MATKQLLVWGDDNLFETASRITDSYQILGITVSNGLFEVSGYNVTGSGDLGGFNSLDVGSVSGLIGGIQRQNLPSRAAANFWADQNIFQTGDNEESVIIRSSALRPLSSVVFAVQNSGSTNVFSVDNVGNVVVAGVVDLDDLEVNGTLTVDSTAIVTWGPTALITNLNADKLDDLHSTQFLRSDADDTFAGGILTIGTGASAAIGTGAVLEVNGTLTVDSSATVTWGPTASIANLNADRLDDLTSTQFLRSDTDDIFAGGTLTVENGASVAIATGATLEVSGTLTVDSSATVTWGPTAAVANLNADRLDDLNSSQFLRSDTDDTFAGGKLTIDNSASVNFSSGATLNSEGEVNLSGGRTTLYYQTPDGDDEFSDLKPNGNLPRFAVDVAFGVSAFYGARLTSNRTIGINNCDCTTLQRIPIVVPQSNSVLNPVYAAGPGCITKVVVATGATGGPNALQLNEVAYWDPDNPGKVTSAPLAPVSGGIYQAPAGIVVDTLSLAGGFATILLVKQRDIYMA